MTRLAEAKAAWERAQAEARRAQAEAVEGLVGSGLPLGEVAELLGISDRELRSLGATTPARPKRTRPSNERAGGGATTSLVSSHYKARREWRPKTGGAAFGEEPGGPAGSTRRLPLQ